MAKEIIESVDEELKLSVIYETEGDAERKNLILELKLPEEAINNELEEEDFEIYNNRVMNQEEVTRYKEVPEEESHLSERPNSNNEIVIIRKPSEHPLFPGAEDNNLGGQES
jgi:hypothetical protein